MEAKPATKEFIEWLREQLRQITPMTRKVVASGEMHSPALFVFPSDDEISVQIIPMGMYFDKELPGGKDVVAFLHQEIANDPLVKASMMLNESYVVSAHVPGGMADVNLKQSIADAPNRREAIVFNCIEDGMQLIATYLIERPANTIHDTWDMLMDPKTGILEGDGAGEGVSASVGRMVIDDRNLH